MAESIFQKLEASRKELLDLSLRNPLVNYKPSTARGVHIVQEKSSVIYDILVTQAKAITFLGRPGKDGKIEFVELSEDELQASYVDTKLQTNETEAALQKKLLATYYAAKTSLEEQGINILYLSLGMLYWYEEDDSEEEKAAPLILVPVTLERSGVNERFRLKYTLEEIGENISLQAKMKADFGIAIPAFAEEFNVSGYFEQVKTSVKKNSRWRVEADSIEVGFFSFAKLMIYNDLDLKKWPHNIKAAEHPVLVSIFEKGFVEKPLGVPEDAFIDRDTNAHELYQVVDADSSQILAMLAVREGRNLVIQGPPGTGKSQTITNIIADAVGQGKKVLFVAEKMAALEVVKRRLNSINIGEACLELHSHKANKKELYEELKRVLDLGKPRLEKLQEEVTLLEESKNELNDYCSSVNAEVRKSGLTVQKIIGLLLGLYNRLQQIQVTKMELDNVDEWNADKMRRAEALADRVQALLRVTGIPLKLVFCDSGLKTLLPNEQDELLGFLKQTKASIESLGSEAAAIASKIGVEAAVDRNSVDKLILVCKFLAAQPGLHELNVETNAWLLHDGDIADLLAAGKKMAELQTRYEDVFMPEAWEQDVMPIRQNLLAYGDKWYKFLVGAHTSSNKQLAALCKVPLPKNSAVKLEYVNSILEYRRLKATLAGHEALAVQVFGSRWKKHRSDWDALTMASRYLADVHKRIASLNYPRAILQYLAKNESVAVAKGYEDALVNKLANAEKNTLQLKQKLALKPNKQLPTLFEAQVALVDNWITHLPEIKHTISWNNLTETATEQGLQCLILAAFNWDYAENYLKDLLQKTWYEYLMQRAMQASSSLRKFERSGHEELTQQFRRLDVLNLRYNQARVAHKHWENLPVLNGGGQVNVLRTEFNKRARLKPIRKVMEEAGLAIQTIKPVFMMSPLSIANFLPPGSVNFDLVVFDEASQVRPVDALGALLRGSQLVVVGDSKQLPPTNFFDSLTKDIEDDENITADIQSILGMCDAKGAPTRMLRWHYRSLSEGLIAFSNKQFYENKLVVFPSPGSKQHTGLLYHYLKDTVYDRGKTRTNPKEADIVAEAVMEHARKLAHKSLGVVAFSTAQRQAVEDALEAKRRKSPETESFFKSHPHEPFFIKNLENVQGDERDVMFISVGYGKAEDGSVSMSFGPLNNNGGERRLNVLITRAKLRCEIFTNLMPSDIDLTRTKSYGIQCFKQYLQFAWDGQATLADGIHLTNEKPFEDNVADKLVQLGYTIKRQVGSDGFYIDIAVVDKEHPGRYILGIECDGAAYNSARSARDRDRLRSHVLEAIGWKIYKVWSTDWFRGPEAELKRLVEAIEKAKEKTKLKDAIIEKEEQAVDVEEAVFSREEAKEEEIIRNAPLYECAVLPKEVGAIEIHLQPVAKIAAWVTRVVKKESPVHFDEVADRIAEAGGIARVGARVRESILLAVKFAEKDGRVRTEGDFLWDAQMAIPIIRSRANLPASSKKMEYIAPEEIQLAIVEVVQNAIAITPDAAIPLIVKMFGFNRVTEEMRKEVLEIIHTAIQKKIVYMEGEQLRDMVL